MSEPTQLDRTFDFILETFVARGHGPHYTEIARRFGVTPEHGKRLLHDVIGTGGPIWLQPGTDLIASFAPFNAQPTQYRVSVDGRAGWFAQCGFEALAMSWVFPGRLVQIDSPCVDCGESLQVQLRDGVFKGHDPAGIVCYAPLPLREWAISWPDT